MRDLLCCNSPGCSTHWLPFTSPSGFYSFIAHASLAAGCACIGMFARVEVMGCRNSSSSPFVPRQIPGGELPGWRPWCLVFLCLVFERQIATRECTQPSQVHRAQAPRHLQVKGLSKLVSETAIASCHAVPSRQLRVLHRAHSDVRHIQAAARRALS